LDQDSCRYSSLNMNPHGSHPPGYPYHHPHHGQPYIVVHDHDILSGRGVNIAQHPGNERFRALVQTRHDRDYCQSYSATEKRAVAEEVIAHIKTLNPPGRFLKRPGRSNNARGLSGPWEELTEREAIRKTCQALRDCNRQDRTGYDAQVSIPDDVRQSAEQRQQTGLTPKQYAEQIALAAKKEAELDAAGKRSRTEYQEGALSPSVEDAAEWLKKQRSDTTPLTSTMTPTTAASSGGLLQDMSMMSDYRRQQQEESPQGSSPQESPQGSPGMHAAFAHHPPSPAAATTFQEANTDISYLDSKPAASLHGNELDPLSEAAAAIEEENTEYAPPSPFTGDFSYEHDESRSLEAIE